MIIGFEAKRLFQNASGLGNYSRNTINLLSQFYPDNKYVLFAPKLSDLYSPSGPIEIVLPTSRFSKRFGTYWRIFKVSFLLMRHKIDLYHGLSHVLPLWLKQTGIPSVVTMHDVIFMRYPEFYNKFDIKLYRFHTQGSCERATKVLAISYQTKQDLIHFFKVDPEKIEVIHQSCNKNFYKTVGEEQKACVRKKFGLPEKFILSVGTIEPRKNQLAILQGIVKEKLSMPVVLLGKPTEYKKLLDEFIVESGIRNQLIFLHNTGTAELQAIYQMAEVMVYPSFFEGFGLPVLEAQASGCPVITSNVSSMPEAGGDGALYVDPSNFSEIGAAIQNILTDSELRGELIRKGTANALLFSDRIVADKLMKLYQSLVVQPSH
jgi:glycosyltransferase involved in cell wall biosynthesis